MLAMWTWRQMSWTNDNIDMLPKGLDTLRVTRQRVRDYGPDARSTHSAIARGGGCLSRGPGALGKDHPRRVEQGGTGTANQPAVPDGMPDRFRAGNLARRICRPCRHDKAEGPYEDPGHRHGSRHSVLCPCH